MINRKKTQRIYQEEGLGVTRDAAVSPHRVKQN